MISDWEEESSFSIWSLKLKGIEKIFLDILTSKLELIIWGFINELNSFNNKDFNSSIILFSSSLIFIKYEMIFSNKSLKLFKEKNLVE